MRRHWLLALIVLCAQPHTAAAQQWPCGLSAAPAEPTAEDAGVEGEIPVDGAIPLRIRSTNPLEAIPLAVPDPLVLDGSDPLGVQARIARTLRRDLELAGFFSLLLPSRYFFEASSEGMSEAGIRFERWRDVGAQGLVKSAFRVAGGQIVLDLRLYDVDLGSAVSLELPTGPVSAAEVEARVHAFASRVVEHYTGCAAPFGTSIAFVERDREGNSEIYRIGVGDERPVALTAHHDLSILPGWAGDEVVYTTYVNGNPDLFATDGRTTRVISARPGFNMGGALSPHGEALAVALSVDGNGEIYLLDPADGAVQARLTDNRAEDTSPAWSPDGRRLAFESDRSGTPQVYVMSRDGSDQRRVTFEGTYNTTPSWSPDGTRLAFSGRDERGRMDVFVVDVASSEAVRLTQDQGSNEDPSWSPDGRYLVFTSDRTGSRQLYVTTTDGTFQVPLIPGASGDESAPAWRW